ncbi:MAG: tyrosine-type recombinase/integrase [Rhodospirillales bacterium]|nr:tyrosine-type recombinase/integrase [Rhodospirillales bacterium]
MKLKDIQCRQAEPRDKPYRLSDGGGMYLEVMPNGSKYWRLKYRIHGKEKRYAIGVYPQTSLGEAREEREIAKKKIKGGIDPVSERKQEKRQAEENSANTFKAVALEWFDIQKDNWSEGYQQKILRIMEMNLFPFIGNAPIANIKPPDLLDCLRKVEKRGALDIAARTKQTAGMIFRYGIQTGKCEWNAADNLAGALKTKRTEHYSALDEKQLPSFLQALRNNEARLFERTRRAVWFSLYTFQRPGEIRQAEWSEIDWDKKEWHIAAHKMKMRRDHIVPLSDQAIEILKAQKEETGYLNTPWVFPSQVRPRNPMSDGTVNKAIKNLGFGDKTKAHGFRALARTLIREKLRYDSEVIEKQLAHKTRNPLGEAYDRTQFLEERAPMMQDWADYIDKLKA